MLIPLLEKDPSTFGGHHLLIPSGHFVFNNSYLLAISLSCDLALEARGLRQVSGLIIFSNPGSVSARLPRVGSCFTLAGFLLPQHMLGVADQKDAAGETIGDHVIVSLGWDGSIWATQSLCGGDGS